MTIPPLLLRAGINYLFRHPWQLLLALSGVSMGVALVLAIDIANSAAKTSFEESARQVRGTATHRIINPLGTLDESVFVNLFRTPGAPPIAPIIKTRLKVIGKDDQFDLIGFDVMAENNIGRSLAGSNNAGPRLDAWMARPQAAMISQAAAKHLNLKSSDTLQISHTDRNFSLRIENISNLSSDSSRFFIFVDIATAQHVAKLENALSYIDVVISDEQELTKLKSLLPKGIQVIDISKQTESILGLSAAFELNLTAMSLLAMLVGIFLIYNAISFSVIQRRNLLGRLRSLGVTATQLYGVIMLEAFLLGVIGSLIGLLLGTWLGQQLTLIVAETISELYYDVSSLATNLNFLSVLKATSVGLLGTLLAAWIPATQAARTKPLTTLSRAAYEQSTQKALPGLAILGIILSVTGYCIAYLLPGNVVTSFIGLFIIVIGIVLVIPLVLSRLSHGLTIFPQNVVWQIAARDLDRHISRIATATAALTLALSTSIGIALMVDSMRLTVADWLAKLITGDLYITTEGVENNAYFPDDTLQKILSLESVETHSAYRNFKTQMNQKDIDVVAASLSAISKNGFEFINRDKPRIWESFDTGAVLISEPLSHRMQVHAGENIHLLTPKGTKPFEVAGVFKDFATEHGRLFMSLDTFESAWGDRRINTLALFSSSASPEKLESQIRPLFAPSSKLITTRSEDVIDESMSIFDRTFRITNVLRLLAIFVAFIGIFSALMAILLERKKEFAVLRALGFSKTQISRLIMIETSMLGFIASLLAVPTGLVMAWILTDVIQKRAFGWSMPFQISSEPIAITIAIGLLASVIAAIYPAWIASHRDPAGLLRED